MGAAAELLPRLAAAVAILLVGLVVAKLVQFASGRILRGLGLDRAARRARLVEALERGGLAQAPSALVARLLFWILLLSFVLPAVEALGVAALSATLDRLVAHLPNLVAAALIALLGGLLARFARGAVASGAAAAGLPYAVRLGRLCQGVVLALVTVLAMDQLGVDAAILIAPLAATLAALVLAAGITFALGAQPVVTHILAGHFLRQRLPGEGTIEFEGRRGRVERIGATDTVLHDGERSWSVPNAWLLERIVARG